MISCYRFVIGAGDTECPALATMYGVSGFSRTEVSRDRDIDNQESVFIRTG